MRCHRDLDVWKKSMTLVNGIYALTKAFPSDEMYGLTSQMRRAAVSVPSNIAEGAARSSKKEFIQFLHVSLGSLAELETQLLIAENLKYTNGESVLFGKIDLIRKLTQGLITSLRK